MAAVWRDEYPMRGELRRRKSAKPTGARVDLVQRSTSCSWSKRACALAISVCKAL